jgi:predicted O-methyltransferase YrrM
MLEIGAYEGRSTVWFLEDILTGEGSHLTTVDTWEGSAENDAGEMNAVRERFCRNTDEFVASGRLTVVVGRSQPFLASHIARGETAPGQGYHIIYVDGSHAAPDVLSDMVLSWALLEPGGVMVCDDYVWAGMTTEQERPRFAIDSFLACFLGQYDELHRGIQMVIRRHDPGEADRSEGMPAAAVEAGPVMDKAATPPALPQHPSLERRRRGKRSRS